MVSFKRSILSFLFLMCVGVLFARRLSLISELTYGNMAVCILQTFHLLTNATCFFKAKRVHLCICACVRVNCTSLGVVNVLWECQCLCALVCVWACLVPYMCESIPLLGKSAAWFASWHCAPLAGGSFRTVRLSWSGHLSSLWRRVAELTEERVGGSAKAVGEQRTGTGCCPPQQDETLLQEISTGSERKHCCV